jgi:hypothetical protein
MERGTIGIGGEEYGASMVVDLDECGEEGCPTRGGR